MAAEEEVSVIIDSARTFASDAFSNASGLVDSAVRSALASAVPNVPGFRAFRDAPEFEAPTEPSEFTGALDVADVALPTRESLRPFREPQVPDFSSIERPEQLNFEGLFNAERPVMDIPDPRTDAPSIEYPNIPDAPEQNIPEVPTLGDIAFPDEPSISVPGFSPERPGAAPGEAPDVDARFRASFDTILPQLKTQLEEQVDRMIAKVSPDHHDRMRALEEKISEMSQEGQALPEHIEQALYDRTRRRTEAENERIHAEVAESAAARGFTMPPGSMFAALQRANTDSANNNSQAAAEVAIEQARLRQENLRFALQIASTLRQLVLNTALQYSGQIAQINEQALRYAQLVGQAVLDVFNAEVSVFNTKVSYYQAQAQVYEIELRASFAELEKYQALVRVEELKSQVNTQLVEQYRQRISAEQLKIQSYSEELRAAGLHLDAERTKIDVFSAEIQAYATRVRGKEAEFGVYRAALEGDRSKVQGYLGEVEAYRAQVQAEDSKSRAEIAHSQAISDQNRSIVDIYNSEVQAYVSRIDTRRAVYEADLRAYIAGLERYQAKVQARTQEFNSLLEASRLEYQQAQTEYETEANIGIESARLFLQRAGNASQAAIAGAGVYGDIASAATSAQNTMVALASETISSGT